MFLCNSFITVSVSGLISSDSSGCIKLILANFILVCGTGVVRLIVGKILDPYFVILFKDSFVIVPKSWEYCNTVKVSCLKWETAWRFSTTVVSNVHNSTSSRKSLLIVVTAVEPAHSLFQKVKWNLRFLRHSSGPLVAVVSFIRYLCFTSETVFLMLSFTYDRYDTLFFFFNVWIYIRSTDTTKIWHVTIPPGKVLRSKLSRWFAPLPLSYNM